MALNEAMRRTWAIFFCVLLVAAAVCDAQDVPVVSVIRMRLLDYKSGRPTPGREVEVMLDVKVNNRPIRIFQKTGKDGIAVFHINAPPPQTVWVMADYPCTDQQEFEIAQVLQKGMVGDHADFVLCKEPTSLPAATAQPGEIVIYIRRLNLWLRFQRFLWAIFNS
jgi:hypothetical protein